MDHSNYAEIELRVAAHIAKDKDLSADFIARKDLYRAAEVERQQAKANYRGLIWTEGGIFNDYSKDYTN